MSESDDKLVAKEERAAAEEAGSIGGDGGDYGEVDEATRPLAEAGEGESEGFELAEQDLVEHASHGDSGPDPSHLAGEPEATAADPDVYGEADNERSPGEDSRPDDQG